MNAFDKIATPAKPKKGKKSTKIAAEVNDEIKIAVDEVIRLKAKIKSLAQTLEDNETLVIDHVRPQQDEHARNGNFSKSFEVEGEKGSLVYTTSDKFSMPTDEDTLAELKKLVGPKKYDEIVEIVRVVSIKSEVLKDDKLVNKIVGVLAKAGIDNIFDVVDKPVAVSGLDVKQYELPEDKLEIFRTLVKQAKASLK